MFHSTFDSAGWDCQQESVQILRKELRTTCARVFFVFSEVDT